MSNRTSALMHRVLAFALGALPLISIANPLPPDESPVSIRPLGQVTAASAIPNSPTTSPRVDAMAERLVATFEAMKERHQSAAATPVQKTPRMVKPGALAPATLGKRQQPIVYSSAGQSSKIQATVLDDVVAKTRPQGTMRSITAKQDVLQKSAGAGHDGAVKTARAFFKTQGPLIGLKHPNEELTVKRVSTDELGYTQVRFAQTYQGIPVFASEVIAHVNKAGDLVGVHGAYAVTPERLTLKPSLSDEQAKTRAILRFQGADIVQTPALVIFDDGSGQSKLAWKLEVDVSPTEAYTCLIDAHSAEELLTISRIYHGQASGSGVDLFGQTQTFNQSLWEDGGIYYLTNTTKPMYLADSLPPSPATSQGIIVIGDAQNTEDSSAIQYVFSNQGPDGPWLADGVSAAVNLSNTYDYFFNRLDRNSLDDARSNLVGIVRVGSGLQNAFFDSSTLTMYFGDADTYAGALDVVAHEMAHGVISTSVFGGLLYHGQSGALNEAFADIFGEMAEDYATGGDHDWQIGTNLSAPMRSMSDPSSLDFYPGRPYPSRFSDFVQPDDPVLNNFTNRDNDGVHINSSIINHAFYLLVTGPNALTRQNAELIFYRTLTTKLTTQSDFIDMRIGAIQSAEELYGAGSAQAEATAAAFDAVEIFETPSNPSPTPVQPISGEDSTIFVYWDSNVGDYFLGRLEAGVDSAPGIQLTANPVNSRPPSVSGDGSFVVFVSAQNDICLIPTDASEVETCLGYPGEVHSVAVAPDGETFGFVFRDTSGNILNQIAIINANTGATETYTLVAPLADGTSTIEVLYADAMDFTSDSRYLIYDAINSLQFTDGTALELWSIYGVDRSTNTTFSITNPTPGFDTGYPNVAQTSNQHLVFDVLDDEAQDNKIVAANVYTGNSAVIAQAGYYYTFPVYVGDDTAVVLSGADGPQPTQFTLYSVPLQADRITPTANPELWLADAAAGAIYRRGQPAEVDNVDLRVSYTALAGTGSNLHITDIFLENLGTTPASNVQVSVPIPDNITLSDYHSNSCQLVGSNVNCTVPQPIYPDDSPLNLYIEIELLTYSSDRELTLGATAFGAEPDSDTGNNTAFLVIDETTLNKAPFVLNPVADQSATEGDSLSIDISKVFYDDNLVYRPPYQELLTLSASGLPDSLILESTSRVIAGVLTTSDVGSYDVTLTATDPHGESVSESFSLTVNALPPPPPPPPPPSSDTGGGGGAMSLLGLLSLALIRMVSLISHHATRRLSFTTRGGHSPS